MANPLHKNKVIQFIKRYPNSEDFILTTGNTPLSNGNTTTSFTPGCSVGLSNQAGNPSNFNDLIDMWVAGGLVRNNINPFGLMRLWAATYRTYYHWCKSVKRPYSNPLSSTVVTKNKLLGIDEYQVKFTGNLNSGTIDGSTLSGAFTQGRYDSATPDPGIKRATTAGSTREISLLPYIPSVLFEVADVSANLVTSLPVGSIAALYGGPIKCELLFDSAVDIDSVLISPPYATADPATPEAGLFNWFYPSNFKIRSSYDGINYTSSFEYNKIITALNQLVQTATGPNKFYDWRQIGTTNSSINSVTNPTFVTALNNISNYSSSTNPSLLGTYIPNNAQANIDSCFTNDSPFPTKVKSIDFKSSSYDLSSFVVSRPLKGHEVEVVTITKSGVSKTCIVKTWFYQNNVARYFNGSSMILLPLQYRTNALAPLNYGYFEVIDISSSGGGIICYGTCESPISMKGVRSLEITSGVVDNTTLRPYIVGFPYVKGTIKSIVTQLNNGVNVNNNYSPTYTDAYWTTYSPAAFDIGNVTFSDTIASSAFGLVNFTGTNVEKWKVMPYTLPSSGIFLESQIKSSSATVREVPVDFNYLEDYINNKIIPLPTSAELIQFQIEADARGLDVVVYYFRIKFSAFLQELINYCKSTCLKFWQYSNNIRSVTNFETYTTDALQFDNSTLPIENVIASGVKTYEIITSGNFDIESNLPAGKLWFLSGGDSSRIDIDIAVLQQLLDIAGITV